MTTTESDLIAIGELVRLRGKRPTDLDNDFAWRRDPELARFDAAQPTVISYSDFAATYEAELLRTQTFRRVMAIEAEDGLHIGNVMFYNIDLRRQEAEIGITIGVSRFRGHGYGSQAISLLVEYIFSKTTINRVYLHTLDWNLRAQRAFKRSGFRDCGRKRRGGYYFHVMEIKREWNFAGESSRSIKGDD